MTALDRYIPITGPDCTLATLLIDTQAPLDALHDAAVFRIRAVTQVLENLALRDGISSHAVVLQDFVLLRITYCTSTNPKPKTLYSRHKIFVQPPLTNVTEEACIL
ncbi:hypothetical protein LRS56_08585 [Pseudomonas poae]|nr:hypothetical protein LRS56_08585 [Pseudomonas poae]